MKHEDEKWIGRTLELAQRGFAGASPNPYVGCVIVKGGRGVGEGAHLKFGGPHAEVAALKQAGKSARGATLYTNLEPCCHWGKTPPCTQAVIEAGIRRVVSAILDPNPLVHGDGFKALRKAGVQVQSGILENEARELNRSFIKFIRTKKPYVILKCAVSLDGKIAAESGDSKWITSAASRGFGHELRARADAVLVGAETVRKDNPSLTSHGKGRNPVRVVLTRSGRLPKTANIFSKAAPTWIIRNKNFSDVLTELGGRGISRLLIEGGGETAAQALESKAVDEAFVFIAPIWIGGRNAKTSFEGKGVRNIQDALGMSSVKVGRVGQDILIRGKMAY